MNDRMRVFADEWLTGAHTGKRFNGTAAYEYAGYTLSEVNPSANASKLLRHPEVQAYIKAQLTEHAMNAAEVLLRFTDVARFEVGDVVTKDPASQRLKIDPDAVIENKRFVKSFGLDSNGEYKIEFQDPIAALRDISRILGMVKDGLDINGRNFHARRRGDGV
ncbi:MAG: terminase small subunit, partial [Thermodesulfobacteriota bacterium]